MARIVTWNRGQVSPPRGDDAAYAFEQNGGRVGDLDGAAEHMHRFRATLYKIGILRCIDVPVRLSRALGAHAAAVRGTMEGIPFRSTLRPRGDGAYRLYVHGRVWRPRGLDAGDAVRVEMAHDMEPRADPPLPTDFLRACEDRPVVRNYVATIAPSLRREIAAWLAAAKRSETRERRIAAAMDRLEERALRRGGRRAAASGARRAR